MSPPQYRYTPLLPSQIRLLTLRPSPNPESPLHCTLKPTPLPTTSIDLKFQLLKEVEETWWQGRPCNLSLLDWRFDRFWDELNRLWEWKDGWVLSATKTSIGATAEGGWTFQYPFETWKLLYQEVFRVRVAENEWPGPAVPYEAVSYYISDEDRVGEEIFIDGAPLLVRENVLGALKRLRKVDRPKVVWVDAVCIDQSDDAERAAQAGIMGAIFRNAKWTSIWLGEHDETSVEAMHVIKKFKSGGGDGGESAAQVRENWRAVAQLADRPYWSWLRIVQELYMSRKEFLRVLCGKDEVTWAQFCATVDELLEFYAAHLLLNSEREKHFVVPKFVTAIRKIMDSTIQPLATLVETCREFKCQDSHDRLYGLLGMAADGEGLSIVPDYGISVRELYEECMGMMVGLKSVFREKNSQSTGDLVKFSRQLQEALENPFWNEQTRTFVHPTGEYSERKRDIKMFSHGEIVILCPTLPETKGPLFHPKEWNFFMEATIARFSLPHLKRVWAGCEKMLTDRPTLHRIVGFTTPTRDGAMVVDNPEDWGLQLFIMQDGSFGIVPSNVKVGDSICTDSDWSDMSAVAVVRKAADEPGARVIARALLPPGSSQRYADFEHHTVELSIKEIQLLSR